MTEQNRKMEAILRADRLHWTSYLPEGDTWEAVTERVLRTIKSIETFKVLADEFTKGVYESDLCRALNYNTWRDPIGHCYNHAVRVLAYERKIFGPTRGMWPYNTREFMVARYDKIVRLDEARKRREDILSG